MRTITTTGELLHQVSAARERGERVGVIPVSGRVHEGHAALVRVARAQCGFVVCGISPFAFGAKERAAGTLPPRRTLLDSERAILEGAGADILYVADATIVGGAGRMTRLRVERRLPGTPAGELDDVATAVATLAGLTQPDVMYVGEKDYERAIVARTTLRELGLAVDVRMQQTIRDPDGIALAGRAVPLSDEQRAAAQLIPAALREAVAMVERGERSSGRIRARAEAVLAGHPLLAVDTVELVDRESLEPLTIVDRAAQVIIRAHVGRIVFLDSMRADPVASGVGDEVRAHTFDRERAASAAEVGTNGVSPPGNR